MVTNRIIQELFANVNLPEAFLRPYYHIGEEKLRMLIDEHPNEDFSVMNGSRALIKRETLERYPDQAAAV